MNWQNIRLVWGRELRDQLRDRRTLFVICILPLLLYPMMGMLFFQLTRFMQTHEGRVVLVGAEQLSDVEAIPQLVEEDQFSPSLFPPQQTPVRLTVKQLTEEEFAGARQQLAANKIDAVVYFPPGFAERLRELRETLQLPLEARTEAPRPPPQPVLFFNSTRETSLGTRMRVEQVLHRWQARIVAENLATGHVPLAATEPFTLDAQDLSSKRQAQAILWSKLLPLVMFVWALTGAFYPAVDLCAGEKERGTLETLLTSPARRSDIVGGKLLTVITFSIASALCNMATLALTGQLMSGSLQALDIPLELPPVGSFVWLVIGLVPMATLFSAMSLALAAHARSTKEGQYYLMPLLMISLPLLTMPLLPGVQLNLSTSLLPLTGMVLLMRAAIEGQFLLAATYVVPVALVTLACCALALRWAAAQFNRESVLFRDTENADLRLWARHAWLHRPETPSLVAAAMCAFGILLGKFVVQSIATPPGVEGLTPQYFFRMVFTSQLAILVPALIVVVIATRSVLKSLLLWGRVPVLLTLLAVLLATVLHPLGVELGVWLTRMFPLPPELLALEERLGSVEVSVPQMLLFMALLPAICEEIAVRGVILSGLRTRIAAGWAILFSALFFGFIHEFAVQQAISAALLGGVLGYIAVKSRHLLPCVAFHMSYNGLHLLRASYSDRLIALRDDSALVGWLISPELTKTGVDFTPLALLIAGLAAALLIWQIGRQGHRVGAVAQPAASPLAEA